ncbi:helix-turn-helix transcriptional regulator [Ochrobactrum sp. SFR4]|nr:helix-turn-helix transcriptional regulator [Ochrobactrum sp. SFR4]
MNAALKKKSAISTYDDEKNTLPILADTAGFAEDENGTCPIREVLDRVGDTWSLLVILNLQQGTVRFNALRRLIEGISQRMLTVTLRSLERDGLVLRTVRPTSPPEVEYSLTALGLSLAKPIDSLGQWAVDNRHMMREERARFDAQQ